MAGDELSRSRLGRGLAALIGDAEEPSVPLARGTSMRQAPVAFLRPNPRNPRKSFSEDSLGELAASIRKKGVVQPILVRQVDGEPDHFEIVAGERRWRAAQRAGLHDVPVIVSRLSDQEALEVALIENVQRSDLNALEEAEGYDRLIDEFKYTQVDLAEVIGKSRSHVANTLRLLKLPDKVKGFIRSGELSPGHARALITHADPAAMAERIVAQNLTVRDTESMVRDALAVQRGPSSSSTPDKDADTLALEKTLSDKLGMKVRIEDKGGRGGELRIRYRTLEELEHLCRRLKSNNIAA